MTPSKYLLKKFLSGERKTVTLVICLLAPLMLFQLIRIQLRSGNKDVLFVDETRILKSGLQQYLAARYQALREGGGFLHDRYYLRHIASRLEAVAERLTGDERQIMLARSVLLEKVEVELVAYEAAIGRLRRGPDSGSAQLSDGSSLSDRIAELERGLTALEELLELGRGLKSVYRLSLERRELPSWKIDREFHRKVEPRKRKRELQYTGWSLTEDLEDHWEKYMYVRRQNIEIQRRLYGLRLEQLNKPSDQNEDAIGSILSVHSIEHQRLSGINQKVVDEERKLFEKFEDFF